jgi:hypothetical protein
VRKLIPVLLLATLALVVACGGDDDDDGGASPTVEATPTASGPADPNAENTFAESLLLEESDFPADEGWIEGPPDTDEPSPFDRCDDDDESAAGRTGEAESGDFSDGTAKEVSHSVAIFDTPESAEAAIEEVRDFGQCLEDVVNNGELDDDEFVYTNAEFKDASFPDIGDRADAYRLTVHIETVDQGGPDSDEGELYLDVIFVTEGRFATFITAGDVDTPFNPSAFRELVEAAHAKLEAANEG